MEKKKTIYLKPISRDDLKQRIYKLIEEDEDFKTIKDIFKDKKFGSITKEVCDLIMDLSYSFMNGPTQRSNPKI